MRPHTAQAQLFISLIGLAALLVSVPPLNRAAYAQPERPTGLEQARLDTLAEQYARASYPLFRTMLSIPNDAHQPDHIAENVAWMETAFEERGFETTQLSTGGPPLLLAERDGPEGAPTVLIYLQIDGQPVDPSRWAQEDPYTPVLKENQGNAWQPISWDRLHDAPDPDWRIFARSASDAKGPVAMFIAAVDAMDGEDIPQPYTIKVIMDFEEELGSPHLPGAVDRHRDALAADALLIFDGPRHTSNRPTLTFGARGIATATLTVYGPREPQHSGHYGNYVPNPAVWLAELIASMKDDAGRVTIPGFYDGVQIDAETRDLLAQTPDDEPAIRERIGIAQADSVGRTLQEAIQYPSLNVRGMAAGWIGDEVRTIIPSTATAELDIRLVPEVNADRLLRLVHDHITGQGYHLTDGGDPTDDERMQHPRIASLTHRIAYTAFRTPYDAAVGRWLTDALTDAFGQPPVRVRMFGGSVPISPFVDKLGLPAVIVPAVNPDNNQHSPNENLRLGNYHEGVKQYLAILTHPFLPAPE